MGTLTRKITASCSSNGYFSNGQSAYFSYDIDDGDTYSGVSVSSVSLTLKNFKSWDGRSYYNIYINGNKVGDTAWHNPNSSVHDFTTMLYDTTGYLNTLITDGVNAIKVEVVSDAGGTNYFYRYNETSPSGGSTIEINVTATYSACSAPSTVKLNGTAGNINVLSGSTVTLSWSGASGGGTYNPITGYKIYKNGSSYRDVDANTTSISVDCPSAGSSNSYTVQTIGSHENSGQSTARAVYAYTNPSAPSNVSIDNSVVDAGGSATLSWSGASAGSGNSISGYKVYRATTVDGSYSLVTTVTGTAATVTAPSTMGSSYFYKVQTVGQYSSSGLSDKYVQLTSRVYSAVNSPTAVSCTPNLVTADSLVTLAWSGATGGTNTTVSSYQIYRSTSRDSGYSLLTSTTGTSVSVTAPSTAGQTYFYKIKVIANKSGFDSDLSSVYGYVSIPLKPNAPIIQGTTNGKSYNTKPRVLATVPSATVVGVIQSVVATGWSASRENLEGGQNVVLRKDMAYTSSGTDNVTFASRDGFNVETGTVVEVKHQIPTWTDDPIQAGTTAIKAVHINELRQAIDDIRKWYGMSAHSWSEEIIPGVTSSVNWAAHAIEVKEQIQDIQAFVNDWDITNKALDISLPTISTFYAPKASVINDLRKAVCLL